MNPLVKIALNHCRAVVASTALLSLLLLSLAALPSLLPDLLPFLPPLRVDTDPENMLSADEPVRVFHDHMQEKFGLWDMIVVGVVNDSDANGVYNPQSLEKVDALTRYAMSLTGSAIGAEAGQGVIATDVIAPSTVDVILPSGDGQISFAWLMRPLPQSREAALEVLANARRIPFLNGTVVPPPEAGNSAVAIYLPITSKSLSYNIYMQLNAKIAELGGPEQFYITGLPVAEDTFGVEMFKQMAISAPLAMLVIFALLLLFFRKLALVISPMLVAIVSVIFTMTTLIIAGFPIHIMSSMIPIFIMPIAVLDSIHILSEVFEKYPASGDRRQTITAVMHELFMPMLYTSLTSAAGFASLALTPIPPVQVFGIFVAIGIMVAWLLTIVFIPAYIMLLPETAMANFGRSQHQQQSWLSRRLRSVALFTYNRARMIVVAAGIALGIAVWGISQIVINDNPIKWFTSSHPIREADRVLNRHLAGTYMAYLALEATDAPYTAATVAATFIAELEADLRQSGIAAATPELREIVASAAAAADSHAGFYAHLATAVAARQPRNAATAAPAPSVGGPALPGGLAGPALPGGLAGVGSAAAVTPPADRLWRQVGEFIANAQQQLEVFKDPQVLDYISELQQFLQTITSSDNLALVGKSSSVADIVKTVHRDLYSGDSADYRIPASRNAVAETLLQFQNSHRPDDLWHLVAPDYRTASIWLQLRSGDNRDMSTVVAAVEDFFARRPPPALLQNHGQWFGLTYINVVWQEKMVRGMLNAFAGSFLIVFLLMAILFRSALWAALCMIPLTVTIAVIYGVVGIIGKDYDMPTAVLSSLTLGLAVDFAIHFLARSREIYAETGNWQQTLPRIFAEPARAISRNIIIIAAGFLPLLLAPLVPYKTVGVLLATILVLSGVSTLLLLPAVTRLLEKPLFATAAANGKSSCNCVTCFVIAITAALIIVLNLQPYLQVGVSGFAALAAALIVLAALGCSRLSRRRGCSQLPHCHQQVEPAPASQDQPSTK